MRFSPRYSIWRKARIFLVFFLRFFDKSRTSLLQEPELGFFPLKSLRISRLGDFGGYFRPAEGPASGGSSAVEQRTVKCLTFQVAQRSFGREFKSPSPDLFFSVEALGARREYNFSAQTSSYGHITVKAPHPIRTAKLSTVELDQYFGRGLQGNLKCCMAFLFFLPRGTRWVRTRTVGATVEFFFQNFTKSKS